MDFLELVERDDDLQILVKGVVLVFFMGEGEGVV